jgi:S-adenosylmethionine/arginine decarboxylase-like enzyme
MNAWGLHSLHNLYRCCPYAIRDANRIAEFTKALVKRIDMKAYGEPQIVRFGEGNKFGFSLVQLIETSCITGHFVEENNSAYIDVFSCKPFCEKEVEAVLQEFFKPHSIDTRVIVRNAEPKYVPSYASVQNHRVLN